MFVFSVVCCIFEMNLLFAKPFPTLIMDPPVHIPDFLERTLHFTARFIAYMSITTSLIICLFLILVMVTFALDIFYITGKELETHYHNRQRQRPRSPVPAPQTQLIHPTQSTQTESN